MEHIEMDDISPESNLYNNEGYDLVEDSSFSLLD